MSQSRRTRLSLAGVAALAVVATAVGLMFGLRSGAVTPAPPCGFRDSAPTTYRHVIVIIMENKDYRQIVGNTADAPYLNQLADACGFATNYHGITHPSLPNYIATTSGSTQGVNDDGNPSEWQLNAATVFSQAPSWRAYQESMASNCQLNDSYPYQSYHNPPTFFTSLAGACATNDVPMGSTSGGNFLNDLQNNTLPAYSWITPNQLNNMHDGTIAQGDAWLKSWVPEIVASPGYQAGNTALFIMWDEADSSPTNRIPLVVVSPYTTPGIRSGTLYNHYSLLRTTEELLGTDSYLGHASTAANMRAAFGL